jgi:hypothetical protein
MNSPASRLYLRQVVVKLQASQNPVALQSDFSRRTAISTDTPALWLITRDNAERVAPSALEPSVTLTPNSSRQSRIRSPDNWGSSSA